MIRQKILSAKGGRGNLAGGIKGPGYSSGRYILGCSSRLASPIFVNGAFVTLSVMTILPAGQYYCKKNKNKKREKNLKNENKK